MNSGKLAQMLPKTKLFIYWTLLFVSIALSSCATYTPTGQRPAWAEEQRQLAKITSWQINGSIGFKYATQTTMANLAWEQKNNNYEITLYSLLDLVSVRLEGDENRVVFWRSATKSITAKTPEKLMADQLGWSLPLTNLRYWVRGLPAPNYPYKATFGNDQNLTSIEQQGWQISYQRFTQVGNLNLPSKMVLINGQIQVKIIIKNWQI
jgi:outer membrane lipoprotein LolB